MRADLGPGDNLKIGVSKPNIQREYERDYLIRHYKSQKLTLFILVAIFMISMLLIMFSLVVIFEKPL